MIRKVLTLTPNLTQASKPNLSALPPNPKPIHLILTLFLKPSNANP